MNVLIIEDEPQAAQRLETLVVRLISDVMILDKIDSVEKSVRWIKSHLPPDLIFMDIQLADGISFQIFEQCDVKSPVIFTTAYDEYALKAFKVNSIDYILKPVDEEELRLALKKYHGLVSTGTHSRVTLESLGHAIHRLTKKYKTRFVIKVGEHLKSVEVNDILFFQSLEKTTFCYTKDGRRNILDFTLDDLEELLDPDQFFRINRKYIVSTTSIQDIISYTNSRLKLNLKNSDDKDIVVARERVQEFRDWLDR
jgi:DNA-binding LytR/AlgR family response regulator